MEDCYFQGITAFQGVATFGTLSNEITFDCAQLCEEACLSIEFALFDWLTSKKVFWVLTVRRIVLTVPLHLHNPYLNGHFNICKFSLLLSLQF